MISASLVPVETVGSCAAIRLDEAKDVASSAAQKSVAQITQVPRKLMAVFF